MLQAVSLHKAFGTTVAVHNASFTVPKGQTLVLLGTSGSGKTTCLRMLNRLEPPTSGEVLLNGQPTSSLPPTALRRQMGYVIQQGGLFPHWSVARNIATVPTLLGWAAHHIEKRTAELLELLGLEASLATRYPSELSGGQQQRVSIARAMAAQPPILLMDEPFGALDPITRRQIRQEFRQLPALQATTTVLVTHDVQEAFELGNHIVLMDSGRIVQQGSPKDLLFRPATLFVDLFFQAERHALELSIVTLANLLPHLPQTPLEYARQEPAFTLDLPLQAVFHSQALEAPRLHILKDGSIYTTLAPAQLLQALAAYRKAYREEAAP